MERSRSQKVQASSSEPGSKQRSGHHDLTQQHSLAFFGAQEASTFEAAKSGSRVAKEKRSMTSLQSPGLDTTRSSSYYPPNTNLPVPGLDQVESTYEPRVFYPSPEPSMLDLLVAEDPSSLYERRDEITRPGVHRESNKISQNDRKRRREHETSGYISEASRKRTKTHDPPSNIDERNPLMEVIKKAGNTGPKIRFDTLSQDRSEGVEQSLLLCALAGERKHTFEHAKAVQSNSPRPRASKDLPEIKIDSEDDKMIAKRTKNTAAARKSRQRKQDILDALTDENSRLRAIIVALGGDPDIEP